MFTQSKGQIKQMKFNITVASKIDEETNKKLDELSIVKDWEKSKTIRNIIKSYFDENKTIPNV